MANETIELLKNYEPKKMQFPAYLSEKLDGVPVRILNDPGPGIVAHTRQRERVLGIGHIEAAAKPLLKPGASITGELYIKGVPFKDLSGMVRNHRDEPTLVLHVFDADLNPGHDQSYEQRMKDLTDTMFALARLGHDFNGIKLINRITVQDAAHAEHEFDFLMKVNPDAEGAVLHSKAKAFQPGKRCWGTQRIKPSPTLDLRVESYEEATDALGNPKGMVGRINVHYQRAGLPARVIGIGPGALSHLERRELWTDWLALPSIHSAMPLIEVKFMPDATYDALRQPTFVRFRPDKTVADVHHV